MTGTGELLRSARRRAGLTQSELATRTGIAQSVISAYESGRREPSVAALRRLATALGTRVELVPIGAPTVPDPERAARQLAAVLGLVDSLPFRAKRRALTFPILARL
ncbi:MAG TPA: helix-turn-helix transcriptional regulator [Acidimicrobiales bacterium]|nr:helix-turn-helix transcriptional regulator [Acidimicrobiales bacterium]